MNPKARALRVALEAARAAGQILIERRNRIRKIKFKGMRDIVTDADFAANHAIRAILHQEFPDHAILSEEDPPPQTRSRRADFLWVIDPLDGTTNYARGYPIYAVSIALAERGRPQVGVVYDPLRDECFTAVRGEGAFLNRVRLSASRVAALEDAIIGFELPREQGLREQGLQWFGALIAESMSGRIGGSAALSLCYVGAGRLDAYFHPALSPWDVAAGVLVAREAGARVAHLDGHAATLRGGDYLAANKKFFPAILRRVSELAQSGQVVDRRT
jgi:myo-inositol-1(or 4)-monophosphatase